MSMPPPEEAQPLHVPASPPPDDVNVPGIPFLPPQGNPGANLRPDYWAVPPQPQAPGWPYAGIPPYVNVPPLPPGPPPPTDGIGPDRVPWRWYDVILAGLPFIFTLALTLAAHFLSPTTTSTTTDVPIKTSVLIESTIIGIVIYGLILVLIWWRSVQAYGVKWSALGLRRPPGLFFALLILILPAMYVAANIMQLIIVNVFYRGHAVNPQTRDITGGGGFSWIKLILALIIASVAAPIAEELFFRGMLYGWLRTRWSAVGGVILSAAIFSGAHAIPLILASIFVVGLTLAIVYEKTKSTLATMTLHSLFNTIGVIAVFIDLARK